MTDRFCKYCKKLIERKWYPSGHYESTKRLLSRKYCDIPCMAKGRSFFTAKRNYLKHKELREKMLKK